VQVAAAVVEKNHIHSPNFALRLFILVFIK